MGATALARHDTLSAVIVRTGAGTRLLLPPRLAMAIGAGVEPAILEHLATGQDLPGGWVDVDRNELARALGTSGANVRRALARLRSLGIVEQKRPRSSLWRIRPDMLERLEATPERG